MLGSLSIVCVNRFGNVTTLLSAVATFNTPFLVSSPASNVGTTNDGDFFKRWMISSVACFN